MAAGKSVSDNIVGPTAEEKEHTLFRKLDMIIGDAGGHITRRLVDRLAHMLPKVTGQTPPAVVALFESNPGLADKVRDAMAKVATELRDQADAESVE